MIFKINEMSKNASNKVPSPCLLTYRIMKRSEHLSDHRKKQHNKINTFFAAVRIKKSKFAENV